MQIACIADLHINCKKTPAFEKSRVMGLAQALLDDQLAAQSLYILGDTFDTSQPSLSDIKLFYDFIGTLSVKFTDIRIIAGNHDHSVFLYLPQNSFQYYHGITYDTNMAFVGWNNIQFMDKVAPSKILFTHARCTIPPFIEEEIDFSKLSKKADIIILGDIHHQAKVQDNIYYTYEPTRNTYTKTQDKSTGYLIVNTETLEVTRRHPILPYKCKLEFTSMADFIAAKGLYYKEPNLYKVVITDYIENLKPLGVGNMIFEYNPRVIVEDKPTKEEEELKEIISQRISISETLLAHTQESYRFTTETLNKVRKRLKG